MILSVGAVGSCGLFLSCKVSNIPLTLADQDVLDLTLRPAVWSDLKLLLELMDVRLRLYFYLPPVLEPHVSFHRCSTSLPDWPNRYSQKCPFAYR